MPRRSRRGRSGHVNMRASGNNEVVNDEAAIEEETSTLPIENSSNEIGDSEEIAGNDTGNDDETAQGTDNKGNLPVKQEPIETPKVSSHESEWIDLLVVGGILVVLLFQEEVDMIVIFLLGLLLLDII